MSLLADQDYFIHALRLSYLRHVLPAHAPHASSIPGTGSYNLIAFDPTTLQTSPYIVASRTHDHALWPELSNGRSSPPLASTLARSAAASAVNSPVSGEVGLGNDSRQARRGATGLIYKETIYGKSGAGTGPGMRVGGRQRSTRSRRATTQVSPMEPIDKADDPPAGMGTVEAHSLRRSSSLEASLHRRRLEENTLHSPTHPQQQVLPPPVVIHSPVPTPHGSRTNRHSGSSLLGQILVPAHPDQTDASELSHVVAASPELERIASPPGTEAELPSSRRVTRFAIDELAYSDELADSGGERDNLQQVDPDGLAGSHPHLQSTSETGLVPSSEDAGSESVGELALSSTGPRNASVASSGVSLFGTLRLGSNDGILGPRDRSDSDSSFPSPAPPETPAMHDFTKTDTFSPPGPPISPPPPRSPYARSPTAPAPVPSSPTPVAENPAAAPPPQFVIPARFMKAPRERRRVNISGRVFVPMAEPVHEEDPPTTAPAAPVIAVPAPVKKLAVLDIPESTSAAEAKKEDGLNVSPTIVQRRSSGPPSLKIDTALASKPPSTASSPIVAATEANRKLSPSANRRVHPIRQQSTAITFAKRPLPSGPSSSTVAALAPPARSNLTALLGATSGSASGSNPFSRLYAALISRASDALKLSIYFPGSDKPSTPLKIGVKKDLTVEEVIGAGLWAYWEERREPELEIDEDGEDDETVNWNLKIVEENGEVDEDFPGEYFRDCVGGSIFRMRLDQLMLRGSDLTALDRTRAVSKFSFGEFAIIKATGNQVKDNRANQANIIRRPSRILADPKTAAPTVTANMLAPQQGHQVVPMSPLSGPQLSATAGVSSSLATGVLLRIRLPAAPGQGVESINTTINVPGDMYMNDVLEHVCKKRNLENAREWAFTVRHYGSEIVVPLDRMVESLGDNHDLKLVRRTEIGGLRGAGQVNTPLVGEMSPSASLFRRPGQDAYQSASELAASYRRYNVMRKLGVLGRHPRIIAIDGDYIHFLPSNSRGDVFSAGRTTSFHISMLRACQTSRRSNLAFKIVVQKARVEKRYDFEAESVKQAHEIVQNVRTLMNSYKIDEATRQQQLQGGLIGVVGTT